MTGTPNSAAPEPEPALPTASDEDITRVPFTPGQRAMLVTVGVIETGVVIGIIVAVAQALR